MVNAARALAYVFAALTIHAQSVRLGSDGKLNYTPDAKGNRVLDFSYAGYRGGGVALPQAPVKATVAPGEDIQAAIDRVSAMPVEANGLRGAVFLKKGSHNVGGSLRIAASGVVLRGEVDTVLNAIGTSRRALIDIVGSGQRTEIAGSRKQVTDAYVPAGAMALNLSDTEGMHTGDRIMVHRPSTAEWIALLGMNKFQGWRAPDRLHWQPGSRNIFWDRVVTAVDGNRIRLDAPITTALDNDYGGASVYRYEFPGRIQNVGIENLRLVSAYGSLRPKDEDHSWFAIHLDKVENSWVRNVTAQYFVSYVINAEADTKWLTIEDVEARDPMAEDASYRGRPFYTAGQLTLFRRCHSRRGRQDFTTGFTAAGPNVFLECDSQESTNASGPMDSWASGVLFDNVKIRGNAIRFTNRGTEDQGAGWAAANSIVWNCEATDIEVQSPPGAYNQAYGSKGSVPFDNVPGGDNPYSDFHRGTPEQPHSLYEQQLKERGVNANPPALAISPSPPAAVSQTPHAGPLQVEDGRFSIDGKPAWTSRVGFQFYLAQMPPALAPRFGPAITRFAPGRTGVGLTDDLDALTSSMQPGGVFYHNYGLWYDRRRVNHNFDGSAERRTGDAWAPFMELPWARSGVGKAWDGLSKYDLTRFNPWFFDRVKQFADFADRRGLILYHAFYFQHWVLETPAHYVDFPWRPANAVQDTGLPDQNPAANVFYDVSNPMRRQLHTMYIRQCLDNLKDNHNVVYGIDREYTGPIEFVRFWLDTVAEWEKENDRHVYISLEVPKDQTDTLLLDPKYRPMITAIGFHGWNYRADGGLFAIRGGINKAPREQETGILTDAEWTTLRQQIKEPAYLGANITYANETVALVRKLRAGTPAMRYRALREYRDQYPLLVVIGQKDEFPELTASIEKNVPAVEREKTRPAALLKTHRETAWAMAAPGRTYLIYDMDGESIEVDLAGDKQTYAVQWLDASGAPVPAPAKGKAVRGRKVSLAPPAPGKPCVAWLSATTEP